MLVAYRPNVSENGDMFRQAFGDLIKGYGIMRIAYIDNTMAAACKKTPVARATASASSSRRVIPSASCHRWVLMCALPSRRTTNQSPLDAPLGICVRRSTSIPSSANGHHGQPTGH